MTNYKSINPATEEIVFEKDFISESQLESSLQDAFNYSVIVARSNYEQRASKLTAVAKLLTEKKKTLAELMTLEMGKPIKQSLAEIDKCVSVIDYYKKNSARFLAKKPVVDANTGKQLAYVTYQPVGVILAIMPWNFPCWQIFRFLAPAVMAGNVILIKHAECVPGFSSAMQELFDEAGWEKGYFQNIYASHPQVETIINDPRLGGVTFTGSTAAGKKVGGAALNAGKKFVLELGGSDPYIVLEDAEIDLAVDTILKSRTLNSGQSCIAAKRVVVNENIYSQFCDVLKQKAADYTLGVPAAEETKLGPLAREDIREKLQKLKDESVGQGAKILYEEKVSFNHGWYFPLTILTEVSDSMPAFQQETFGPLLTVTVAKDDLEAIELAGKTSYGLGAAVFSRDINKCKQIAEKFLAFGNIAINDHVVSNPLIPFGGLKDSGVGKELGQDGIYEFVHKKSVLI